MTGIRGRRTKERCVADQETFCFTATDSPNADKYVTLFCDELETLRLKNMEGFDTISGGEKMHISKSTFARVYTKAINKITDALVHGKTIRVAKRCYLK